MPQRGAIPYSLLLLALFGASLFGWHSVDTRPSSMDETRHMKLAMDYRATLFDGAPLTNEWSHVYPPVYHLSLLAVFSQGIPSETKAAAANLFYILFLIAGAVMIIQRIDSPKWAGVLAIFLCISYTTVIWASRRAMIDFPLMAWVTFSMALLMETEGFATVSASLLWGAAAGIGFLLKPPFLFFIIGPVSWTLLSSDAPQKWRHLLFALLLAGGMALPWYVWQGGYFVAKASSLAAESQGLGMDPHTVDGWLYYLRLLKIQMGMPALIISAAGALIALLYRPAKKNIFLVLWILSGYVALSLLVNKDPRHSLPLLPAIAILAAEGWASLGPFFSILAAIAGPALFVFNATHVDLPQKEEWKHSAILEFMTQHRDRSQPFMLASVLSHHPRFFSRTLKWSAIQRGIDVQFIGPGNGDTSFVEYIVTRPGNQGSETNYLESQWKDLSPNTRAFKMLFSLRQKFALPERSEADVYQRTPHPHFNVAPLNTNEIARRLTKILQSRVQGPLTVTVEADPADLREGRLKRVRIACSSCSVQGVQFERLGLVVEKPWLNLYRLWDEGRLGLLAFESLTPTVEVTEQAVGQRIAQVKGLQKGDVQFRGGRLRARVYYKGIPITAVARPEIHGAPYDRLEGVLDSVSLSGIPFPGWLLGKAHRQILWLYPVPEFPGKILIHHIEIENGILRIS